MNVNNMGVINITPDSFSDGNQFNNITNFSNRFEEILKWSNIIDIGAESTAPKNQKVAIDEELRRFEQVFFPVLEQMPDPQITISIDTYKVEVFEKVAMKIHKHWPSCELIFNDVSGVLDDKLLTCLSNFDLPFSYVFSHNLCKGRSDVLNHMNTVSSKQDVEFIRELVEYFKKGLTTLELTKRKVLIDPCFGFSKTREQNHTLLKFFKTFLMQIPYEIPCIYGISRKSFLRFPKELDIKDPQNAAGLEQMQAILFYDLVKEPFNRELIVRVHDGGALNAAKNVKKIFDI